ncbi:MAG: MerR family DNA-binding transcriptional regulator [Spirochaetia bacterium]
MVGVTPETLRKWDRDGELLPDRRSKSGTRFCGAPPATHSLRGPLATKGKFGMCYFFLKILLNLLRSLKQNSKIFGYSSITMFSAKLYGRR